MNGAFQRKSKPSGIAIPFGAASFAAAGSVFGGLVGLFLPRAWLEELSFQLYLDTLTKAAKAPLGMTAQLLFALALALFVGALAYAIAKLLRVRPSGFGLADLLARLRGGRSGDEADAPTLRAADRHPDAPARRPFSAARDIPGDAVYGRDEGLNNGMVNADAGFPPFVADEGEEELLLDTNFVAAPVAEQAPAVAPVFTSVAPDRPELTDLERFGIVEQAADAAPSPRRVQVFDEMDYIDLSPPMMEDWEDAPVAAPAEAPQPAVAAAAPISPAPQPIEPVVTAAVVVEAPLVPEAVQAEPPTIEPAPAPRMRLPERDPLDLSAARLDELLARLESGLSARNAAAADGAQLAPIVPTQDAIPVELTPVAAAVAADAEAPVMAVANDPAFPHDPALAAALATLRRLNLKAG